MQVECKAIAQEEVFEHYDYIGELEEKVLKRIELTPELADKARKVASYLSSAPRYITHGDFHFGNILDIGNGKSCIIDFERTSMANQVFDLAFLLEQAEFDLSKDEKKQFVDYFVEQLRESGEQIKGSFSQLYNYNAAFVNLREARIHGNKSGNYYDEKLSKKHLERAIEILNIINYQ